MKSTGLVYEMRRYTGEAIPPLTVLEDASRYGSDGNFQASGHPAWVRQPSGLWELDFDSGTPDYIEIPASFTQLDFTSENFSVIVRVKFDDLDTDMVLLNRGGLNADGYRFFVVSDGKINIRTFQSGAGQVTASAAGVVTTATWFTLGCTRNGVDCKVYKDGVDVNDVAGTHTDPLTSARTAKIGVHDNLATLPIDGKIAYLAIWNYALSVEQHAAYHQDLKL